jgi:hypothetical protein
MEDIITFPTACFHYACAPPAVLFSSLYTCR